jgi:hypothetical protein
MPSDRCAWVNVKVLINCPQRLRFAMFAGDQISRVSEGLHQPFDSVQSWRRAARSFRRASNNIVATRVLAGGAMDCDHSSTGFVSRNALTACAMANCPFGGRMSRRRVNPQTRSEAINQ